ncbi:hypothetical protein [Cupriavidus sp. IDO]|uniref:hypothetical protein n=1 Tax=Cupriavidus sp. IDO TaxID=1539142 RepID=UPI000578FFDB|nr:hypothetical protein [Cupriavidus sp. IDO]KWR81105.1 hypothetical protein RM96_29485 [Cupriavidus sp. IDO]
MRKFLSLAILAGLAAVASTGAQAHVNVGVGIGFPVPFVAAPVYAPAPVYSPPPVVVEQQPVVVAPAYYDDWRERAWRERQWREQRWREHMWRERHREWHRWHDYDYDD